MVRVLIKLGTFLLFIYSSGVAGFSQDRSYIAGYILDGKDTVYVMKTIYVFPRPHKRSNSKEWREYYKLIYNFKKTYPYALLAKEKIQEADSVLASKHLSKREEEKYIKKFETQLFREFEKPLRKMSFSQGRLLMKLIDREVGLSTFYIIKNYRGGFTATFWQGVAKMFGSNLKNPYDKFGEDKLTEELVTMYYDGSFDYLYYSLYN
ncbi:MAG: DUF4294 domain-containing protein [Bacteroidales bacterium]